MRPTSLDVSTLFTTRLRPSLPCYGWRVPASASSPPLGLGPSGWKNRASGQNPATVRQVIRDVNRLPSSDSQYSLDQTARPHENAGWKCCICVVSTLVETWLDFTASRSNPLCSVQRHSSGNGDVSAHPVDGASISSRMKRARDAYLRLAQQKTQRGYIA